MLAVRVTEHAEVGELPDGAQVAEEKTSPATFDVKVTRPDGLDFSPDGSTSVTVAVTVAGEATVAGFGESVTAVVVARGFTTRLTAGVDDEAE